MSEREREKLKFSYHVFVGCACEHWMNRYNDTRNLEWGIRMALNLNGYFCDAENKNISNIYDVSLCNGLKRKLLTMRLDLLQ